MLFSHHFQNDHRLFYRKPHASLAGSFSVVEIGYNSVPAALKQMMMREVYIIHYVLSGSGSFLGTPFHAGDCYIVMPGEFESIAASEKEPYESVWVMVKGRRAGEIIGMCDLPKHNAVFSFENTEKCGELIKKYLFEREYASDLVEACSLEELFYKLMAIHFEKSNSSISRTRSRAAEIADYIEKNYANSIKVSDICDAFYLSKNYLCTVFKREYGVTPQEYLISYRMEKAKQLLLLKGKDISVSEISFSVGIENPLYFSRCFHARFGASPSEYRKKHLG